MSQLFAALWALALSAWLVHTQTGSTSPLPSPIRLSGIVTDAAGQPLSQVSINHALLSLASSKTDALGRFEIETRAPAIVFRKAGFQGKYLRIANDFKNPLTIVLSGPAPPMKPCTASSRCAGLRFFGSAFCLPRIHGVHISKQVNDVDYGCRGFWVPRQGTKVGVQHGSGPMWGDGLPQNETVWSATEYKETDYVDSKGFLITDARGKTTDGKYWRTLGHAFETVEYAGLPAQDAAALDPVIDGACVEPTLFGLDRQH